MEKNNPIKGKTVLITGGTGFLGRALLKKLLEMEPKSLRVFSRDEVKHNRIVEEFNNPKIRNLVGDVRDSKRIMKATKGADIVIHAAAMKRIDMIEYNVTEAIKTNVLGTMNVVDACLENDVEKAVFVSTDKACSPINSYGATKLLGERIFIESNYSKGFAKTTFSAVRYGNVIESTGSVIPYFIEKIKNNDEIPITDERMVRFIITPERAVQEVLTAIKYGLGGEIFIPKLQALKIVDLVETLKEHFNAKNKIKVVGIRPGEKIDEWLMNEDETTRAYDFEESYVILHQIGKVEKYQDTVYSYLKAKEPVKMPYYSSKDFTVSKAEIKNILKKTKVL